MNETTQSNALGASREKFYSELTQEEKMERARQMIKNLARQVAELQSSIHHLRRGFLKHSHSENGVVVPWSEYPQNINGIALQNIRGEDYF